MDILEWNLKIGMDSSECVLTYRACICEGAHGHVIKATTTRLYYSTILRC